MADGLRASSERLSLRPSPTGVFSALPPENLQSQQVLEGNPYCQEDSLDFFSPSFSSALRRAHALHNAPNEIASDLYANAIWIQKVEVLVEDPYDANEYIWILYRNRLFCYQHRHLDDATPKLNPPQNFVHVQRFEDSLTFDDVSDWYRGVSEISAGYERINIITDDYDYWGSGYGSTGNDPRFDTDISWNSLIERIQYDRQLFDYSQIDVTDVTQEEEVIEEVETSSYTRPTAVVYEYLPSYHLAYWGDIAFNIPDHTMIDVDFTTQMIRFTGYHWLVVIETNTAKDQFQMQPNWNLSPNQDAGSSIGIGVVTARAKPTFRIMFLSYYHHILESKSRERFARNEHVVVLDQKKATDYLFKLQINWATRYIKRRNQSTNFVALGTPNAQQYWMDEYGVDMSKKRLW